ncbi:MAG: hydroxyquinol 1,2-dioxygenase [Vicinamibacterales bacterium]
MSTAQTAAVANALGYKDHSIGGFTFKRDEYFAHIFYPGGRHIMQIDAFLRALMRDVAWGFFYGTVNFDTVFGTVNHYGTVEMFIGLFNEAYRANNRHHVETFESKDLKKVFEEVLADWTNEGFDPFAAPDETGTVYGAKKGNNIKAITRQRLVADRMVGLPGDLGYRTDKDGFTVNRQFQDVPQDKPEIHAAQGFENEVHAFNFFEYVSRSDVTWNPSVVSCVKDSQFCATTEEHVLPITHGNDRVEWFIQATDEIIWDIDDRATGRPRAKVTMRAGDVAAMPANIRHRGYSPKRSILIVWENNDGGLPQRYASGELAPNPVDF